MLKPLTHEGVLLQVWLDRHVIVDEGATKPGSHMYRTVVPTLQ